MDEKAPALYNDFLFSISDSAFRMGISDSTLRKYEKQGVITPSRSENSKYRYFDSYEYARVASCLEYKQYGMSINEAVELMNMTDIDAIAEKLHQQQIKIEARQEWSHDVLDALIQLQKDILDCRYNRSQCRIETFQPWIYISPDWYMEKKQDETLKQVVHKISELIPISRVCSHGVWENNNISMTDAGKVITKQMAEKWAFDPYGRGRIIDAKYCVTASMSLCFKDLNKLKEEILKTLHYMKSYAEDRGFHCLSRDIYMITILKTGERGHFITYRKLYMLLGKSEKDA